MSDQKPSAAAMKAAGLIMHWHKISRKIEGDEIAKIIDAALAAERKAADETATKLRDVRAACMYHGFSDIPRQIDATLAAYDAARKGE